MPRSSVYVRLQWPAEGDAEEAGATSPQPRDTPQSPLSHTTHKVMQPHPNTQEGHQVKEEGSGEGKGGGGGGGGRHAGIHPSERRREYKVIHKCNVCPAKSQESLHPPASPPPACSMPSHVTPTSVVSSPASTSATSTTTTTTTTTTTSATKHTRHAEAAPGTQAKVKVKVRDTPREKLRRNLTERIPRTIPAEDRPTGTIHPHRSPHLDISYSLDSPLWYSREQARIDAEGEPQDGCQEGTNKPGGVRMYYKSKARLRPKNPNAKSRRITRSLSASCVSVSTNTDPKDFLELAKISGTLPSRKEKDAHSTKRKDVPSDNDNTQVLNRTEKGDGIDSNVADSKGCPDAEIRSEVTQKIDVKKFVKKGKEEDEEDGKCSQPKGTTEEGAELVVEEDISEKPSDTRCAGDGCDDAEKGYIELPTYTPSHSPKDLNEKRHDHLPSYSVAPSCPSHTAMPCGPPYPSFHAHTGPLPLATPPYFTQVAVKGTTPTEEQKFIAITPHLTCPPGSDLKQKAAISPSSDCPSPSAPALIVCPVSLTSSPTCDYNQMFPSFKPSPSRTFHLGTQDDADLTTASRPNTPSSGFNCTSAEASPLKETHQQVIPRLPTCYTNERYQWVHKNPPAYPSNRPPTPAVPRRHMDQDMSLESCPDVVLQTLEAEGASGQNKTLKKSVTFLLPPDHWDSLISLRESSSMWACDLPPCITKASLSLKHLSAE